MRDIVQFKAEQYSEIESPFFSVRDPGFVERSFESVETVRTAEEESRRVGVEREGADLIAMASHGRTGLARVFYGSVAAGILHKVDRPLLLIRSEGEE